jgi:hypothetical protein
MALPNVAIQSFPLFKKQLEKEQAPRIIAGGLFAWVHPEPTGIPMNWKEVTLPST